MGRRALRWQEPVMTIRGRFLFGVVAAALSLLFSYLVAEGWVSSRKGFGRGDLVPFWGWNVLFGCGVLFLAYAFAPVMTRGGLLRSLIFPLFLGLAYGFAFTLLNRQALGGWFGAWSFPVLYCWTGGGGIGLAMASLGTARFLRARRDGDREAARNSGEHTG